MGIRWEQKVGNFMQRKTSKMKSSMKKISRRSLTKFTPRTQISLSSLKQETTWKVSLKSVIVKLSLNLCIISPLQKLIKIEQSKLHLLLLTYKASSSPNKNQTPNQNSSAKAHTHTLAIEWKCRNISLQKMQTMRAVLIRCHCLSPSPTARWKLM